MLRKYHKWWTWLAFLILLITWMLSSPMILSKGGVHQIWYALTPPIILIAAFFYSFLRLELSLFQRIVFSTIAATGAFFISTLFILRPFLEVIDTSMAQNHLLANSIHYSAAAALIILIYQFIFQFMHKSTRR